MNTVEITKLAASTTIASRSRQAMRRSAQRSRSVPEIPTVAEAGVTGFDAATWFGLFAPTGTPPAVIAKLNREVATILAQPELAQRLSAQGSEPRASTPAGLADYMRNESARWRKVIASAGIKAE